MRKFFSLSDARLYNLVPFLMAGFLLIGKPNTPEYGLPVLAAALACIVPLLLIRYEFFSLITIFVFTHFASYPLAAMMALSLKRRSSAIPDNLWAGTPDAMWACAVGMLGLALGVWIANRLRPVPPFLPKASMATSAGANVFLTLTLIPAVVFKLLNGMYFHGAVTGYDGYNFGAASSFGFIGYFEGLSTVGAAMQIYRYSITQTLKDAFYTVLTILIPAILLFPSGSRIQLFAFLLIVLIVFLACLRQVKLRLLFLAVTMAGLFILTPLMDLYRITASESRENSFLGQFLFVLKSPEHLNPKNYSASTEIRKLMVTRRLADYVSTGKVIDMVPSVSPYRYFEGVGRWWVYLVPTLVRPKTDLSFAEGAILAANYGLSANVLSSSPIMVLGDWYSRFGWTGIFLGMTLMGFLLRMLDCLTRNSGRFGIILFVFLAQAAIQLYTFSLLVCFVFFTRNLIFYSLFSYGVMRFFNWTSPKQIGHQRYEYSHF